MQVSGLADDPVHGMNGQTSFDVLKERVAHIDDRLKEIAKSLEVLNTTINEASKPKWHLLIPGTALLAGFCWYALELIANPIEQRVKVLEMEIVPHDVHVEKWAQNKEDIERLENEIKGCATKDDMNRLIIDFDQRLPRKK